MAASQRVGTPMDGLLLSTLLETVWGGLEGDDVLRWFNQEFEYAATPEAPWGLRQRSGGPCGVLAAVQGYILYQLMFNDDLRSAKLLFSDNKMPATGSEVSKSRLTSCSADELDRCLAHALAFVMWQAGEGKRATLVTADVSEIPLSPETPAELYSTAMYEDFTVLETTIRSVLSQFKTASGVILVVFSVLLSRGLETVSADMDEPTALVARFGHCSQELLNLMLIGEAVSGVFDGEQKLRDETGADVGVSLRGISKRPIIGYLSHIEAMRYSKIGEYYKSPLVPIWVVGSESHLTVLFSNNLAVNEESPSAGVYRVFKKYDEHDNQFIPVDKLGAVLRELEVPKANDEAYVNTLSRQLDSGNMGFIVWADFWSTVAPLMPTTGATTTATPSATTPSTAPTTPAPSSSIPAAAPSFEELKTTLKSAFDAADELGGGFITADKLNGVVHAVMALLPPAAKLSNQELLALHSTLTAGQDPSQAIILWSDLEGHADPLLRQAQILTQRSLTTASAAVSGNKRPRSDSDVARALDAELNAAGGAGGGMELLNIDFSALAESLRGPTAGTSGRSAYDVASAIREFELFHYNGIEDRGRKPRLVRLTARQSDTGLPPTAGSQDEFALRALNGAVASTEAATAAAIARSLGGAEIDTAEALTELAAGKRTDDPKAAMFVNILRTKWPGVTIVFDGLPPSLD